MFRKVSIQPNTWVKKITTCDAECQPKAHTWSSCSIHTSIPPSGMYSAKMSIANHRCLLHQVLTIEFFYVLVYQQGCFSFPVVLDPQEHQNIRFPLLLHVVSQARPMNAHGSGDVNHSWPNAAPSGGKNRQPTMYFYPSDQEWAKSLRVDINRKFLLFDWSLRCYKFLFLLFDLETLRNK